MKKTTRITLTMVGLAALTIPSITSAQGPPPGGGDRPEGGRRGGPGGMSRFIPALKAIDVNQDGEFSAEEIKNATAALLTLDKNEDGKLDAEELRPNFPGRGGDQGGGAGRGGDPEQTVSRLMAFDKNKDGKLTKDELSERMQGLLTRADTNKDGAATKDELLAMAKAGAARGGGGGERRRPQGGGDRPQRPPSE